MAKASAYARRLAARSTPRPVRRPVHRPPAYARDMYQMRAQKERLRCRAAYKLVEMDDRHHLLRHGSRVVDLGAAPGGFATVTAARIHLDTRVDVWLPDATIVPVPAPFGQVSRPSPPLHHPIHQLTARSSYASMNAPCHP